MDGTETLVAGFEVGQIGLAGLVSLVIFSIIKGWLLPVGVHRDRVGDKDAQIVALSQERDDWKLAFQNSEAARSVINKQNSDLIVGAETTNRLMESLRNQIERGQANRSDQPQRQIEE